MVSVPRERALQLINLLAGVAGAAHWLADNSEDCGDEGIDCQRVDFESLSDALDKCEELPELPDSPYVRDGWLRAADELRALLAQPAEQHQGSKIADALEACEWPNTPIGNKAIILSAIQALRAEQRQGEPVALPERKSEPTEESDVFADAENSGFNACLDEIAKLGPLYSRPAQGEPVAVLYADGTVLTKTDCGDGFEICCKVETPLYTHADPGKVERLRDALDECDGDRWRLRTERDTLRAQLAERDALLRGALSELQAMKDEIGFRGNTLQVMTGIEAALSASAEPEVRP
jgi:hypothetical protein